jgi:N6-adenosine-specific RNA methylase IME4
MTILGKATYKNVSVIYKANELNRDNLYISNGNVIHFDDYTAIRLAESLYKSPRNENKRKRIEHIEVIESLIGGKTTLNNHAKAVNKWAEREFVKLGGCDSNSIVTMLKNKGY